MVCRATAGSGSDALNVKVSGWRPALRVAIKAEVTVRVDGGAGADGFKAVFNVVMRVEEGDRAVGDGDAPDFRKTRIVVGGSGWPGGRVRPDISVPLPLAPQPDAEFRMVDHQLGDFRMARPQAGRRHVGLNTADGQAIAGVEILRILQRHIAQGDMERRPQSDPGRTAYRQAVTGFALDPLGNGRRHEAGGDSDDQEQGRCRRRWPR